MVNEKARKGRLIAMKRTTFDMPDIPWELVDEARRRTRLVCERRDLDLREPALSISWDRPQEPVEGRSSMSGYMLGNQKKMLADPAYDLRWQLVWIRRQIEHLRAGEEVGLPLANHFCLHMLHFGTGPLATAFGATMIVRDQEQPSFEPAIHAPEEALRLRKPDLRRAGILPEILKRIDFYNEATGGKIPMTYCDTASAWSIGTQLWHYEDMLEATVTAPEAVHHFLELITDCIIEWHDIQKARMGRWTFGNSCVPDLWFPRGTIMGDDCMVTVSPETFRTFFLPYNNRISRAFGGLFYHCCMRHDFQFAEMAKTEGFLGMDADVPYNNVDKIISTLDGRGVFVRKLDISQLPLIRRMKGRVGCCLHASGACREDAIRNAKRLLAELGHR
jgi:hypothetical protein